MKKRLLSVLLCLCMVMALLPTTVLAAFDPDTDTNISNFDDLKAAFDAGNGRAYTLTANITVTEQLNLGSGKTLTINGGGHTIQPVVTGLNGQGIVNSNPSEIDNIIYNRGTLTLNNLTIYGGKGRCISNSGTLTMNKVSLERSHLTSGYGAGLYNEYSSTAVMTNCNIRRNGCDSAGGGFYNNGKLILENCAIVENRNFGRGTGGGGGQNSGTLYMNNCTVANNQSSEVGGGINNYLFTATAYIMNSTFTGNVTTATNEKYGGGIGNNNGAVYAVNNVFAFNYANGAVSDIGMYYGNNVYLYNCAYRTIQGGTATTAGCTALTATDPATLFNGARTSGIVDKDGKEQTTTFARPVITPFANDSFGSYGVYPKTGSDLLSGGTKTYYDRTDSTVKMSYGELSTALGGLTAATTSVDKYQDGTPRTAVVIGALPGSDAVTMYTVKVNPAEGGTVTGGSALGNSYPAGTSVTLTAVPDTGYIFKFWKENSAIVSTDNPYTFEVVADWTLTPVFTEQRTSIFLDMDENSVYTFEPVTEGYIERPSKVVTVTNNGTQPTGPLTVSLSGGSSFELYNNTISNIGVGGTATFTVAPKRGLSAATYTDTVIVSGTNIVSKSFQVKITVNPAGGSGSSSDGGGSYTPPSYKVDTQLPQDADGRVSADCTTAKQGDKVTITVTPDRYYKVDGVVVKDRNGKKISVTENADGTFSFKMPAGKVTVEPIFSWDNPFADVAEDAYYAPAVEWALKNDITGGTTAATFSPNAGCTRAQIVTFLWRAAGSPAPKSGTMPFDDVAADAYYHDAVLWAMEQGITTGTSDTTFSPDAICTRSQSMTFLYHAAGSPGTSDSIVFSDVAAGSYYADAVVWAAQNGVTSGTGNGEFSPNANCTRAQIMTFLYRWLVK